MKITPATTLAEMAAVIDAKYIGPADHLVSGINEIHRVEPGDLTFVDVEKYFKKALSSAATTILLNKEIEPPAGKGLLISDNPFRDYNLLTEHYQPTNALHTAGDTSKVHPDAKIGQNVVLGTNVEIGAGTEIGHNTVIGCNVVIGDNCRIYGGVFISDNVIIGNSCCIQSGVRIGGEAFYFKKRDYGRDKMLTKGRVVIGDNVDIGTNTCVDRGVSADTIIGEYTKIDNLVQIGHDTVIGKRVLIAASVAVAGVCNIEDDVTLWGQVGLPSDVRIGQGAVILGQSGVLKDAEPGKVYMGSPATEAKQHLREISMLRNLTHRKPEDR